MFETIQITPYVHVEMIEQKSTRFPAMIHTKSCRVIKSWASVEGLEQGAWYSMLNYAERAAMLEIRWDSDDPDDVFPFPSFIERYLDPVGFGEKSIEEVSAMLMERVMREAV